MKPLDRFQLETGDLDRQVIVGLRLSLLFRLQGRPSGLAERCPQIAADECAFTLLRQHFPNQRHGRAFAVCARHRENGSGEKPGCQFEFTDHFDPASTYTLERRHAIGNTRTDDHEVGVIQ